MISRVKQFLVSSFSLGLLLAGANLHAADLLPLAKDIKPGEQGLPAAFVKPLKMSICFFDVNGKSGEYYGRAQDLALIAKRWNIIADLKVFQTEEQATQAFRNNQCEGAVLTTLRARQFNRFMGSVDSPGSIPNYQSMQVVLKTLLDPKLESYAITKPYQVLSLFPIGAQYLFVRDRSIDSIDKLKGKTVAVLDWDKSVSTIVTEMGAKPVAAPLGTFAQPFNKGDADAIIAPAIAFWAFGMDKGSVKGGVFRIPVSQLSAALIINRDLLAKKTNDLDDRVAAFHAMSAQFLDQMLNQFFTSIQHQDKDIPEKLWIDLDAPGQQAFNKFLTDTRFKMTAAGDFDPKMMKVLKKVRCSSDPKGDECSKSDE